MSEREINITRSIERLIRPWASIGVLPPQFLVSEIAREAGIQNPEVVLNTVNGSEILVDSRINGKLVAFAKEMAQDRAPYKRAVRKSGYRSREPGGGPVVKRRILEKSLRAQFSRLGAARVRISFRPQVDEEKTKERVFTKDRLAVRWKSQAENSQIFLSRNQKEEARRNTNSLWRFILSKSVVPPERSNRAKELIYQAMVAKENIFLVNWVCPAGTPLALDAQAGKLYRRFTQSDPEDGFSKDYRLYPRIDLERDLASAIQQRQTTSLNYLKIVADNNPYCIYPTCIKLDGEKETIEAIERYTRYIQSRLDQQVLVNSIWVIRWSEILGQSLFGKFLETFRQTGIQDLLPFLPENVIETELDVIAKHTSLSPELVPYLRKLVEDVIRQYAVEGYFLYELFGDNVILAWNESTRRSSIIDSLRKARGIPPLPKIYVLHEKRDGKIVNNF